MCGEHFHDEIRSGRDEGSSPHVRGTPPQRGTEADPRRIIPACAGNTNTPRAWSLGSRDHPRMCGEHPSLIAALIAVLGSSPHVRGTLLLTLSVPSVTGIIPACAGNTAHRPNNTCCTRDHPRMCGEHAANAFVYASEKGSSPHVRGTPNDNTSVSMVSGIIPACAGNTANLIVIVRLFRDHPRMCGEHGANDIGRATGRGSSPHVRGTHFWPGPVSRAAGIIPACAGNTFQRFQPFSRDGDHPRMCGEHYRQRPSGLPGRGSSPHVRGTLLK
ncbi:hypothetical protein CQR47_0570 [Bifidobacterium thermophilum]|uniref:Uncharacterized protein n=1 Tax=Bifidobacterium thermophilum TaxID=33905 RepID=A0A2N3QM05_9BIFI|nr:hypothetical protein CQR47_0570 [Bifidobacterium thermophilum]